MGGILSRLFRRDDFKNRVVPIHGVLYQFQRRLGSGGSGTVYSARGANGRSVAIKVININGLPMSSQKMVQVYLNEVALLGRLQQESDHVVVIYDFDFDAQRGLAYIVMELGGENLGSLIYRYSSRDSRTGPNISPTLIRNIWRQMVSIIGTLHGNGVVHMDLKPQNLIFFGRTLKIADLGIARKADALGYAGVGTPFFGAPEIMQDMAGLQRFYSSKADIWSLGAILYSMVYGRPPTYHPFAADPPPGFATYPDPVLNDVLRRTLVLDPDRRADITTLMYHPFTNS